MRMRCFDIWVHDQDIRSGLGIPGDLDSLAAVVAARQMLSGLARSWAKSVKPESHQTARLIIEAPGLQFAVELLLDEEGRGRAVVLSDEDPPGHATTSLATSWSNFAAGCTGRVTFNPADVTITGDTDLADRLLASLNIAP